MMTRCPRKGGMCASCELNAYGRGGSDDPPLFFHKDSGWVACSWVRVGSSTTGYCSPSLSLRYLSTSARTISRTRSFTPWGIVNVMVTFGSSSFFFRPDPSRLPPHAVFFSPFCIVDIFSCVYANVSQSLYKYAKFRLITQITFQVFRKRGNYAPPLWLCAFRCWVA